VAPTTAAAFNTLGLDLVPVACLSLADILFDFDSSFPHPDVALILAQLPGLREKHKNAKGQLPPLSVFGHADPVGQDEYNKALSGRRARAVYGLLTHDLKIWNALFNEEWVNKGVLPGLRKQLGAPATKSRDQLFQDFMNKAFPTPVPKSDFLAGGADPKGIGDFQGCSDFNPLIVLSTSENQKLKTEERNKQNEPDRRVVVFLFRPGPKVDPAKWPCPAATEGTAKCRKQFFVGPPPGDLRRKPGPVHKEFAKTKDTFACRFFDRIARLSPCEAPPPPPPVFTVASLLASLQSTKNAATGTRPADGTFTTANTALDFAAPANDLMVVIQDAGEIVVKAQNIQPPTEKNRVRWQIDRDPNDTAAAGTPGLDTQTGEQVKVTPNTPGSFRLICFRDANGNNKHDNGEELRVLRMVIVRITPQAGGTLTTNSVFTGAVNGVSTGAGGQNPMTLQADFLLEGGGANRRFGLDQVVLANVGNLLNDTFVVNYPARAAPNDTRNGTETEDPDFQTNPAPGFPSPMVDTVNVAQGNEPTGGNTPNRGNSVQTIQGNGPGGNGQIRRINSLDTPAFGWDGNHPTTNNPWATTQGANAFREWILAHTNAFPRNYVALGQGDWTVNVIGTRGAGGRWTDNGSSVALTTAWTIAGFPQTADAARAQVLGRSFVREFGMIVNP